MHHTLMMGNVLGTRLLRVVLFVLSTCPVTSHFIARANDNIFSQLTSALQMAVPAAHSVVTWLQVLGVPSGLLGHFEEEMGGGGGGRKEGGAKEGKEGERGKEGEKGRKREGKEGGREGGGRKG